MPTFRYTPLSSPAATATIEAPDRAAAVRELLRQGITPSSLEPVSGGLARTDAIGADARAVMPARRSFSRSVSRAQTALLIRELATALQAGLPLVPALATIRRQISSDTQRAMLDHLIDRVEHGKSLADAAAEWGRPFGDLLVGLIRAGESAGRLEAALDQAAELLDRDLRLRRAVLAATLYPAILAILVAAAVTVITTFIVPSIVAQLEGQVVQLPWPTRVVMGLASVVESWWWLVLLAIAGAVYAWNAARRDPETRLSIDRSLLRLPLLGRLLRDIAVARFTRTLGTLTTAGVPILTALRSARDTLGNLAMQRVIDEVGQKVSAGTPIAEPLERSGYFPPMLVQIVNLGERSGRLEEMLLRAADALDERTQTSLKLVTTALPPILVVLMASIVGFVIVAILLPFLEFQEAILQ